MKAVLRAFALPGRMILLAHQKLPRNFAVTIQALINLPFMLFAMLIGLLLRREIDQAAKTVTQENLIKVVADFPRHEVDEEKLKAVQQKIDDFIVALHNTSSEKLMLSIADLNLMSTLQKRNLQKSDDPTIFTPANFYSLQSGFLIEDSMYSLGNLLTLSRCKNMLSFIHEDNVVMERRLTSEMQNFETQEYSEPSEEKKPLESSAPIAIALGYRKLGADKFVQLARQIKKVEISQEGITLYS